MNPAPNLFFIGPMGAGKTTVGRRVAELLELPFFDLDHEIEARTGAAVPLIFDLEGEAGFRRRETMILAEFGAREGIVLATGGGAVLHPDNRRVLGERGFVVWLETSVDAQLARLERDRNRPLLAAPDRRARLDALADERNPHYETLADLRVASAGVGNGAALAKRIADLVGGAWRRGTAGATA